MPQTFDLVLNSTFEESEKVPDFVNSMQKECGLSDEITGSFMLLLSEAVSNAIDHGNEGDPEKKVFIRIEVTGSEIHASVRDEGEGFRPDINPDPLSEENLLKSSGRGVFLLKELADKLEFKDEGRMVQFSLLRN